MRCTKESIELLDKNKKMKKTIEKLNKLMLAFYEYWEKESTNEMFLLLNGNNDTKEMELVFKKYNEKSQLIEDIINSEKNFETIIENWTLIDLKMLDALISSFGIEITTFEKRVKESAANKEIKEFFN